MPYITEYSDLSPKEKRQLSFKRKYKNNVPTWDDSMVFLKSVLAERLSNKSSVLDYGCGHANYVLDELGDMFEEKVGLDVAEDSVTSNTSVDSVVINKTKVLPFDDDFFDSVISLWVLEHIENPRIVFQEVSRVLKSGGMFAFVTPNKSSLLIRVRRLMSKTIANRLLKFFYDREEHDVFPVYYRSNTLADISNFAKYAGLNIEVLKENPDPSYTSFNLFTYWLSKQWSRLPWSIARPHIIGLLRKS